MAGVPRHPAAETRQRLDLRVTPEQKRQLERAAVLRGQSLTALVLGGALREAEAAIREHDVLTLSEADSRAFVQALLDPPPISPRLLEAIERYEAEFHDQAG
jgi:uncharacterized protein (DUF1778 family)